MAEQMSWKQCVEQKIITASISDKEHSAQMLKMAELRFEFWNRTVEDKYTSLKIEAYYDIIRELIFAHLYKNGFNCTNHLCLIAYLKEKFKDFDYEIEKIDELRKARNDMNYRGFFVKNHLLKQGGVK